MSNKDLAKFAALVVAMYGGYTAWQAWKQNENVQNGVTLIAAGVAVYSALNKF